MYYYVNRLMLNHKIMKKIQKSDFIQKVFLNNFIKKSKAIQKVYFMKFVNTLVNLFIIINITFFLTTNCSTTLLKKDYVQKFNKNNANKKYEILKDIYIDFSKNNDEKIIFFKKGDLVRLVLEQSEDWVKIRAYKYTENKEQAQGKIIYYYIKRLEEESDKDKKNKKVNFQNKNKNNEKNNIINQKIENKKNNIKEKEKEKEKDYLFKFEKELRDLVIER